MRGRRGCFAGMIFLVLALALGLALRRGCHVQSAASRRMIESPERPLVPVQGDQFSFSDDWSRAASCSWQAKHPVWVYEIPPTSGRRVAAEGRYATISPDGTWVAYENDGVCVASADGKQHWRLTAGKAGIPSFSDHFTWSSDGRFILYFSMVDGDLYAVALDGSTNHVLLHADGLNNTLRSAEWLALAGETGLLVECPVGVRMPWVPQYLRREPLLVWIKPDASAAVLFVGPEHAVGGAIGGIYQGGQLVPLYSRSIGTAGAALLDLPNSRVLVWGQDSDVSYPVPSPDGLWAAFSCSGGAEVVAMDGSRKVRLAGFPRPRAWSRDGKWVYGIQWEAGHGFSLGKLVAIDWQRKVRCDLLPVSVHSPWFDAKQGRFRFRIGGGSREWGAAEVHAWLDPDATPPLVHIEWPRKGTMSFAPPGEVPVTEDVYDVQAESPKIVPVQALRLAPAPAQGPLAVQQLPVQALELGQPR